MRESQAKYPRKISGKIQQNSQKKIWIGNKI
jgi:hypothetical protein